MLIKLALFGWVLSGAVAAAAPGIPERLEATLNKIVPRLACNLSPSQPKFVVRLVNKVPTTVKMVGKPGSVVASPETGNPDYYFHWLRDSGFVAESLVQLLPHLPEPAAERVRSFLTDFAHFSHGLQETNSVFGLGDPRFNVDGTVDTLAWGRPQHDGPALQALALLDFYREEKAHLTPEVQALLKETIRRDANHLSFAYQAKSFDLWEISFGHHFFTGMADLSALVAVRAAFPEFATREWPKAIHGLEKELSQFWDEKRGLYHFSLGSVNENFGKKLAEVGDGLDASTALAANLAYHRTGSLSARDPKVLATVWKAEEYFRHAYPFNRDHQLGPAMGRHPNDDYFGGNPWYLLTATYAEFYYRLAADVKAHPKDALVVTARDQKFWESLTGDSLPLGRNLVGTEERRASLVAHLLKKGDAFLDTVLSVTGGDGAMSEQFGKDDGKPISARDLTWSYSSFLSAVLAREAAEPRQISFAHLNMVCP